MIRLQRTTYIDPDFNSLVKELDSELAIRDGEEHAFYSQFNKIDALKYVVVAYSDNSAVACGALKDFPGAPDTMEVKRMYTKPQSRGYGVASLVLNELEKWAHELSRKKCILETGTRQPEAIALYTRNGYKRIPNYGQYLNIENSVCFEKML